MSDAVQQSFVRSFIVFLKKQVTLQSLAPDALESVEVAIQCLQAAFDVEEVGQYQPATSPDTSLDSQAADVSTTCAVDPRDIQLFELFQSVYIERSPEKLQLAEAIKNDGNRLMLEGKYNEALYKYNQAVTYDPKNPIFYCNRAAAHIRLGDNDRAVIDCKSALVYNRNYGKAYGRLGIAYSNLGKYAEAQQVYAKAIQLEPDNQDYRHNFEVARIACEQLGAPNLSNLTDGFNAMLGNPAIRNLFSNADIDLQQVQNMTQNPMVMNYIGQLFNGMQGAGMGAGLAGEAPTVSVPPMSSDMLQLFQTLATQLANASEDGNIGDAGGNPQGEGGNGNDNGHHQPPPST